MEWKFLELLNRIFKGAANLKLLIAIAALTSVSPQFLKAQTLDQQALPVYLLLGQSNMVGMRSLTTALPDDMKRANPNALFFKDGAWIATEPGKTEPQGYGPEIAFANAMASYGKQIGIIKLSAGDTKLAVEWNPTTPGTLYAQAIATYRAAAATRPIKVVGVLWMQGESDGGTQQMADAYQTNMYSLIAKLRADTNNPDLKFAVARQTSPPDIFPFTAIVRAAQTSINDAHYKWFDCDQLTKVADNLHYDSAGQIALGGLFATTIKSIQ